MGIPQMSQSRGQFGSFGALIVVVIAAVMYLALGALGSGLICVIGYRFIHALNNVATWVLGVGIVMAIAAIFVSGVPATFWSQGGYTTAGFLATVSLRAL